MRKYLKEMEARVGFEPTNGGFADLSLGPLGYRAGFSSIANLQSRKFRRTLAKRASFHFISFHFISFHFVFSLPPAMSVHSTFPSTKTPAVLL
jgi:hypothetical protein